MLQKYLRALLAQFVNKKDGEFISTQCTPSSNIIDIKIPTTNDAQRYTAPCNGYLVIGVESLNGVSSITSWGKIDSTITANMSGNGHHSAVFVPMQKGDVQHYTSQTKYRYVHFVKMMGGG